MTNASRKSTARIIGGNILIYVSGGLLIGSAAAKLLHIPGVLKSFQELGYEGTRLTAIAALEAFTAILFMTPRTRSLGLLLVSAYLGGAIAVHVGHAQSAAARPAIFLGIIWIGAWLRHAQILWSFNNNFFDSGNMSQASARLGVMGGVKS